jgi:hypothetical protein
LPFWKNFGELCGECGREQFPSLTCDSYLTTFITGRTHSKQKKKKKKKKKENGAKSRKNSFSQAFSPSSFETVGERRRGREERE